MEYNRQMVPTETKGSKLKPKNVRLKMLELAFLTQLLQFVATHKNSFSWARGNENVISTKATLHS